MASGVPIPDPSATSRELLRALPLEARRRDALGLLVREVEVSLFGGESVNAEDYARCRRSFDELAAEAA